MTRAVRDALDPRFTVQALPRAEVKGIAEPIEIFALRGYDAGAREPRT